jgi:hypothetical protein
MAGKPLQTERLAMLDANADYILELFEAGESMKRIAMRVSDKLEEPISESLIGRWSQKAENAQRVTDARVRAADAKAEHVVESAETLVRNVRLGLADRDDIAATRHEAETQRWIAGVWNRDKYGQQTAAQVTVNVGAIHLDSLRQAPAVAAARPPELAAFDVVDVEAREVEPAPRTLADLL